MREILQKSEYWGRIKPYVMFAFTTKYALALYEALCLRRNLTRSEEIISVEDFREMLGVGTDKLTTYKNLNSWAISPAVEEINALSDFTVQVEPIRQGGQQRGMVMGFRVGWEMKEPEEWERVLAELMRSKVGRKARIKGTVERVSTALEPN
jgi:plasmid replication initiation protein